MTLEELMDRLAVPRDNGTEGLLQTASFIGETLGGYAPEVTLQSFTATPHGIAILTGVGLLLMLAFAVATLRRRYGVALIAVGLLPMLMLAEMEWLRSPTSWLFSQAEQNVIGVFPGASGGPTLIFCAHYDAATQFGDHLLWARWGIATMVALVVALLLVMAGLWRSRRSQPLPRWLAAGGALLVLVPFVVMAWFQTVGPLVRDPSPGAMDNAGSVAVLLKLAERLATRPSGAPTTVKLVFVASEEERALGSWHYARSLDREAPLAVINLELMGGSESFAYVPGESFVLRSYRPPVELVMLLDSAARDVLGQPVSPAPIPRFSMTDARSFLAHDIPALTLMARFDGGFPRGLHSPRDTRDRVSLRSLARSVELLGAVVARVDGEPHLLRELK